MLLTLPPRAIETHAFHQRAMPQRENACAAFALSCLLRGLGFDEWQGYPVDQDLIAYLAGMVALVPQYPSDSDPGTALQAAWGFPRTYAYPLERSADLARVGTGPEGLVSAVETVSAGAWMAVPLKGRTHDGRPWGETGVWSLVDLVLSPAAAPWEAQVLFNYQTGHLAALEGPGQGWGQVLLGEPSRPCEWDVGHVTSLAGVVPDAGGERALVIRDSSPRFGWRGYHAEQAGAVSAALARTDGSQGGVLVLCRETDRAALEDALRAALPHVDLELWDNGSQFRAPAPLSPRAAFATERKP